jgi:hypothetical protein
MSLVVGALLAWFVIPRIMGMINSRGKTATQ